MPSGEKTEKATAKHRKDERKKGNILQSRDIVSAFAFMGMFSLLYAAGPYVFGWFTKLMKQYLSGFSSFTDLSSAAAAKYMTEFAVQTILMSLPFVVAAAALGFIIDAAQTRMNFSVKLLKPDFNKINPISGMKRVINARSMVELVKAALKVVIVSAILYSEIKNRMPQIISLSGMQVQDSFNFICSSIFTIAMKTGIAITAFGVLDYFYQWWSYERRIRMTKQEIKDEYKQLEGDPKVKGHIKEQQRKISNRRVLHKVKAADVVIRNPTHFAVAIKYDKEKNHAPVVVAKGRDYLALKIVEIAEAEGVAIRENPPLARGLYETVETGREIPEEFYQAVAEVLAFVYGLKRGKRRA